MTKKSVLIVGAGAGGATIARSLADRFQVRILDQGGDTPAFRRGLTTLTHLRGTGLLFHTQMISWLVRRMAVHTLSDGMRLVCGHGPGGTTPLAAGNGIRADEGLQTLGLRLDDEFNKLERELPITPCPEKRWTRKTQELYGIFQELGMNPRPTPKLVDFSKCTRCGKCVLGCAPKARWDARTFLADAIHQGAELETNSKVERFQVRGNRVVGIHIKQGGRRYVRSADLVVLAAGGLGTPRILEASGITTDQTLFVDPVVCVAAEVPGAKQNTEFPMPFISRQGPILLSPYFDWLSFFFHRRWRYPPPNILSLMIKLADTPIGHVSAKGKFYKSLTPMDHAHLQVGVQTCRTIFERLGIPSERTFLGMLNAGHPGGTLALTSTSCSSMHDPRLPDNCWVADTTLLPGPFGMPPILTVMALALRVAKHLRDF